MMRVPTVVRTAAGRGAALRQAVTAGLGSLRWWIREFSGSSSYDKYVARHRIEHPDHEPMCARDFWRQRAADAERSVQAGCC